MNKLNIKWITIMIAYKLKQDFACNSENRSVLQNVMLCVPHVNKTHPILKKEVDQSRRTVAYR